MLKNGMLLLKGDSRLASSHLEIYISLFQPATVVSKKFHQIDNSCFKEILSNWQFDEISLKQLLRVGTRIHVRTCISQDGTLLTYIDPHH